MVLIRNNVKKESTYGWYPSQVNIYENPRAKHGYDKECLFRHWQSSLHPTNSGRVTPVTPPGFRGSMKSTSRSRSSKASPSCKSAAGSTSNLMLSGTRPASLSKTTQHGPPPQFVFDRSRPSSIANNHIPTPRMSKGYHGWQPQPTIIGVIDPSGPFIAQSPQMSDVVKEDHSINIETPQPNVHVKELVATVRNQLATRPFTPAQNISGSFRVQSASLNRPRVAPSRSIKSAGVHRSPLPQAASSMAIDAKVTNTNTQQLDSQRRKTPTKTYWTQVVRENTPEPDNEGELERPATPVNLRSPTPIDTEEITYESQLDKYGWLAEVHGDPFNIKVLTERLPYTVRCEEPVVAEYPFKTKVTAGDTFFLNTIPRKPMTFAVHPEWQSENFVAKRKELDKQGRKFHPRSFGFAY